MVLSDPITILHNDSTDYFQVIQKQTQEIQQLQHKLSRLQQTYLTQLERAQQAEQAQTQATSELEELSRHLFEQANAMVSDERRARSQAEHEIERLRQRLSRVADELDHQTAQLTELREKVPTDLPVAVVQPLVLDPVTLAKFQAFVGGDRTGFYKECLMLDVEPCARLGRISVKRLLEVVAVQPCFIEQGGALPVVRRSSILNLFRLAPQDQCVGCGQTLQQVRFRFKLRQEDREWQWIDLVCRDRLVAVCDFFAFVRHLKSGLQSQKSIQALFRECVWLRLCMFWARSGIHFRNEDTTFHHNFLDSTLLLQ